MKGVRDIVSGVLSRNAEGYLFCFRKNVVYQKLYCPQYGCNIQVRMHGWAFLEAESKRLNEYMARLEGNTIGAGGIASTFFRLNCYYTEICGMHLLRSHIC